MALVAITCLATVAAVRPALAQSAPAPRVSEPAPPARLSLRVEFRERMESLQSIGFTGLRVDGFASSVVRVRADEWDRGGFGNRFHGVYGSTTRVVPDATLEPYVLWREDGAGAGRSRLTTTGVRLTGRIAGRTDDDIESVVQRGTTERDDHRARTRHMRVRTPVRDHVRVVAEYNYASGDRTAGDGRRETFDPLYNTAGAAVARVPDGASGRRVGQGFDIQTSPVLTRRVQVAGGYACVMPGAFLRAATPRARLHAVYVMATIAATVER